MGIDTDLTGKVAIVTGGASGIGEGVVRELVEAGVAVAILDRDQDRANHLAEELGVSTYIINLADADAIPGVVERVVSDLGRIDIFVHCAAAFDFEQKVSEIKASRWDVAFAVNVKAAMLLTQNIAPLMIAQGDGGKIVYVASTAAFRATSPHAYGSSKAALVHFTHTVASELAEHHINVNCVAPGPTKTPITGDAPDQAAVEKGGVYENMFHSWAEVADVARPILFLCLPASRQMTAQVIHTSAGTVY